MVSRMKYCMHCGMEIDAEDKVCPFCSKNVSEEATEKMVKSNIECVKCHSKNVEYRIIKRQKRDIDFEEEQYICKDCGRQFTDRNRLGSSFNNNPQIILNSAEKKLIKWIIVAIVIVIVIFNYKGEKAKKVEEAKNWERISCNGLPTASSDRIYDMVQENKSLATEQYLNKNFIFTGTIYGIYLDDDIPNIRIEETVTSPTYYLNFAEVEKAKKYNKGDKITVCGTITKMGGMYSVIQVENVIIVE